MNLMTVAVRAVWRAFLCIFCLLILMKSSIVAGRSGSVVVLGLSDVVFDQQGEHRGCEDGVASLLLHLVHVVLDGRHGGDLFDDG